jgi:hypothetical protein
MFRIGFLGVLLLLLSSASFAQVPQDENQISCDGPWQNAEVDPCLQRLAGDTSPKEPVSAEPVTGVAAAEIAVADDKALFSSSRDSATDANPLLKPESDAMAEPIDPPYRPQQGFQWGAAIKQSGKLLAFQQGMMLATDRWARYSLTQFPLRQYFAAVRGGLEQWDDGDPFLDNYIGHPLQGAVSGYIQVQNDPRGRNLVFGNNKAYWKSRAKAMGWIAVYSTQFEIGPISEASIEKLGSFQYQNCDQCPLVHGAGWVDIVVTPTIGAAWLVGEDAIDRFIVQRIEGKLGRGKWSNFFRSALNPARVAANVLRMKAPWYRDRDHAEMRRLTD